MKGMMIRCVRCKGRKKMYKMGSAYSHTNSGGEEVTCPMCLGVGTTKTLADAIAGLKEKAEKEKEKEAADKDIETSSEEIKNVGTKQKRAKGQASKKSG